MRKYTLFLLFISLTVFSQETKLKEIGACYGVGENIKNLLEQNNISELKAQFEKTDKLSALIKLIKSDKSKSGEYKLRSDIYYNPDLDKYVFTIYHSKWIKTDSDWGLNDYLFVIELLIEYEKTENKPRIIKKRILDQDSNLKNWWQSLMNSYNNPKFMRKTWATEYKLVPPPPPAPQTMEWFKK